MLLNIASELDGVAQIVTTRRREEATTKARQVSRAYLNRAEWDWKDLRDYVVYEIQQRFGVQDREPHKETGVFKGFMKRWGADAEAIARYAFEVENGWWKGKPVDVNRFCKGSDPWFAEPILDRLRSAS